MGKKFIYFTMTIGMTVGGALPMFFGDNSLLDGWTLLGGLVGGLFGVWVGVKLLKLYG